VRRRLVHAQRQLFEAQRSGSSFLGSFSHNAGRVEQYRELVEALETQERRIVGQLAEIERQTGDVSAPAPTGRAGMLRAMQGVSIGVQSHLRETVQNLAALAEEASNASFGNDDAIDALNYAIFGMRQAGAMEPDENGGFVATSGPLAHTDIDMAEMGRFLANITNNAPGFVFFQTSGITPAIGLRTPFGQHRLARQGEKSEEEVKEQVRRIVTEEMLRQQRSRSIHSQTMQTLGAAPAIPVVSPGAPKTPPKVERKPGEALKRKVRQLEE
jgi:hypothetical protein